MSNPQTFYTVGGVDLSNIFQHYTTGTPASTTGYTVAGHGDLNNIFAPYTSGIQATEYTANNKTMADLIAAGFTSANLYAAGYTIQQVTSGGLTLAQLSSSGFKKADYEALGYTIAQLQTAGFTKTAYDLAGYTAYNLLQSNNYTVNTLIETLGYNYIDLLTSGYSVQGFIFDISNTVWNAQSPKKYPIKNTGNSFTDLSYSAVSYSN